MTDAVIGAGAVVLAALIAAVVSVVLRRAPASKFKLVNISFPDSRPDPEPRNRPWLGFWFDPEPLDIDKGGLLDVVVRNEGGQPTVITKAIVWVEDAVTIEASLLPHFTGGTLGELPSSATYEVGLPPPDTSRKSRTSITLRQTVSKTDLERFKLVFRATKVGSLQLVVYRIRIGFEHDGKTTPALSGKVLVCHPEDLATSIIPPATYVMRWLSVFLGEEPPLTEQEKQKAIAQYLDSLEHAYQSFERVARTARLKSPMAEIAYRNCLDGLQKMQALRIRFLPSAADRN